jgi:hypothetical protein
MVSFFESCVNFLEKIMLKLIKLSLFEDVHKVFDETFLPKFIGSWERLFTKHLEKYFYHDFDKDELHCIK